jgi:hypothetical protein
VCYDYVLMAVPSLDVDSFFVTIVLRPKLALLALLRSPETASF